jgi:hypothetical protein
MIFRGFLGTVGVLTPLHGWMNVTSFSAVVKIAPAGVL